MNVYIELIVGVAVILVFLIGVGIIAITKYTAIRGYKPENDRGKQAEESRRLGFVTETKPNLDRSTQPEEPRIFPSTTIADVGEDSIGSGDGKPRIKKGLFRRRRK